VSLADIEVRPPCQLYPRKRTFVSASGMSALCQKRTPAPQQKSVLFDHFVRRGQQRWRYREAERLGRFHINDQLKFSGLLRRAPVRGDHFPH